MSKTFNLGPIAAFLVHYGEDPLHPLCKLADQPAGNTFNTATTDEAKVTCKSCIEWRHA